MFFLFFIPFLYLRTLKNKKIYDYDNGYLVKKSGLTINKFSNTIFDFLCRMEFFLFKQISLLVGGSIILAGER